MASVSQLGWKRSPALKMDSFYLAVGVIISKEEGNFIRTEGNLNSETQTRGNYHNSAFFLGRGGGVQSRIIREGLHRHFATSSINFQTSVWRIDVQS